MGSSEVSDNIPIENLNLTMRSYATLKRGGIVTVAQLVVLSEQDLMGLNNFTPAIMEELRSKLKKQLDLSPWGD
jgi:DNA-directed RNA polymerase subunit alpha